MPEICLRVILATRPGLAALTECHIRGIAPLPVTTSRKQTTQVLCPSCSTGSAETDG